MQKARIILSALTGGSLTLLALGGCSRQPEASSQTPQPDTVVTSRSNGKAVPNPRRGSYKKSEPGTWGYKSPN
jgi:hypothetical protein